jgi:hypothetical protein
MAKNLCSVYKSYCMTNATKSPKSKTTGKRSIKKSPRKWSGSVTKHSNALDLKASVFKLKDPGKIAASLKRSAEKSKRKKGTPLQSAMSMLNFYINRAGKNLSAAGKKPLEKAKPALRALFKNKKENPAVSRRTKQ